MDRPTALYTDLRGTPPPLGVPAAAMTVGAHPDDAEFGAGATLARWADLGCRVVMVVLTDGSKGSWAEGADPMELARRRREEQRAAADVLGAAEVVFGGRVDGELEYSMELRAHVCSLIREHRPDVVLGHDPWQPYQLHPDHRAAGWGLVDGVVAARDHLFFPEQVAAGLSAHRPGAILLWSSGQPDHWEDATGYLQRKVDALLCHTSQGESTMAGATAERGAAAFAERIREWAARAGAAAGLDAAEAFKRLTP